MRSILSLFFSLVVVLTPIPGAAQVELNPSAPETYTVRRGDTLWDIAGRYLRDPWRWPELWEANREIQDPYLIFPGDVLRLQYVDGAPRLALERPLRTVRLSPQVRSTALEVPVPTIPVGAIAPFLTRPYVLSEAEIDAAPYVVGFPDRRVIGGLSDEAYVRSILDASVGQRFGVVRPGEAYRDPRSGAILGFQAQFVADAVLDRPGDPAKLRLTSVAQEAGIGDRVLPAPDEEAVVNFYPQPAPAGVQGQLISVLNGVSQIGQFNVVVLNLGEEQGLARGHVFEVFNGGERVIDQVKSGGRNWNWRNETPLDAEFWYSGQRVEGWITDDPRANDSLPKHVGVGGGSTTFVTPFERAGTLMVFRTFPRVSFGLVLGATRPMHVLDTVRPPKG